MNSLIDVGGAGEHTLRWGEQEAVVVEAGGGLRTYSAAGADLVAGYPAGSVCPSARGQWLVPWPNRIRDGRYTFAGTEHRTPLDPGKTTAIHGMVRWLPFQVLARAEASIELGTVLTARPGYPWTLRIWTRWSLGERGLTSELVVENVSDDDAPYAAGTHPYLALGGGLVDDVTVTVPGATILLGEHGMMTQRTPVDNDNDFRTARIVGESQLGLYTDLSRDTSGLAHTVLERPDGWRIALWQDEAWPFVLLYTADSVSVAEGRRRSLAVEPMTAAVDAFNTGDGLITLEPGGTFTGTWGISASRWR
ncbi:aldose 1-epimerase family protein [Phytoactinopolyspora limicola]|uniref:aldose 1-epimerase family protein n=1 Tax=Phytoactinopolyspora limicola TaxID=2715536 RepID=UPI00140E0AEA|nr:aldose 1-epimerase family protein [Phytoactinopolyspora limicola]